MDPRGSGDNSHTPSPASATLLCPTMPCVLSGASEFQPMKQVPGEAAREENQELGPLMSHSQMRGGACPRPQRNLDQGSLFILEASSVETTGTPAPSGGRRGLLLSRRWEHWAWGSGLCCHSPQARRGPGPSASSFLASVPPFLSLPTRLPSSLCLPISHSLFVPFSLLHSTSS